MEQKSQKVTINDIARAAGVSKATVSRYLNGKYGSMSSSTKERIEKTIELSHYRPSAVARSLKTQQTRMIGVVISDITSPFSSSLITGVEDALRKRHYIPIFVSCGDSPQQEQDYIRSLLDHQVDGLIVNTTSDANPFLISLACTYFPIVLCDRQVNDYVFDISLSDYHAPVLQLIHHLKEQGFSRICLFTQEYKHNSARSMRRSAFIEGNRDIFGAKNPDEDIYVININHPEETAQVLRDVISGTSDGGTPAVIGVNSVTIMHTLSVMHSMNLRCPYDLGVCGPDDWGWNRQMNWSELIGDGITTFVIHPYEIGKAAGELIIERLENPDGEKKMRLTLTDIVYRNSTLLKKEG